MCRLQGDVAAGIRIPNVIERSLAYLPLYQDLRTVKADTSAMSASEVARALSAL